MVDLLLAVSVCLVFVGHVAGLGMFLRNQRWMHWPPRVRTRAAVEVAVSVIVPARNEASDIGQCLRSLLNQDYSQLQIIAVNDHSEDNTPKIMDEIAAGDPRLRVIHNPPLNPGWLGKHNAMQAAFEHVDSELVLLTDADVAFEPPCISLAVGELQRKQLDLLSIYPQFQFISFCETLLVPFYVGGAAVFLSPAIESPQSRHAMATGAFILMRTECLRKIGGFDAIKSDILDDVCMARKFKEYGFAIGLRSAPDLMRIRFFKNNRHAFFGATKHLLGSVQEFVWVAPLVAMIPLLMYGVLVLGLLYGCFTQSYLLAGLSFATLVIHYVGLLLSRPGNAFSALKALAFPFMAIQIAAAGCRAAYLLLANGTFQWRGRTTNFGSSMEPPGRPVHGPQSANSIEVPGKPSGSAHWS